MFPCWGWSTGGGFQNTTLHPPKSGCSSPLERRSLEVSGSHECRRIRIILKQRGHKGERTFTSVHCAKCAGSERAWQSVRTPGPGQGSRPISRLERTLLSVSAIKRLCSGEHPFWVLSSKVPKYARKGTKVKHKSCDVSYVLLEDQTSPQSGEHFRLCVSR